MNRYYISVAGWNGAGVTAPCIIIGREFEAETEREAGEAAEKSADEQFPGYAPFAVIRKVVYNDFDCAYKSDLEGFNLDDTVKGEVEVKKMAVGIYYMGEILIPVTTEDKHMVGLICWSQLAPVEDEIKNNGFIRYYQRKRADGRTYYVVKNGMRVRAAVTSYSLNEYAEATLQELVAMLAETHTGEPEEHEQTFDNLTDEVENEANNEDV